VDQRTVVGIVKALLGEEGFRRARELRVGARKEA
jgi:hypothetical protein